MCAIAEIVPATTGTMETTGTTGITEITATTVTATTTETTATTIAVGVSIRITRITRSTRTIRVAASGPRTAGLRIGPWCSLRRTGREGILDWGRWGVGAAGHGASL